MTDNDFSQADFITENPVPPIYSQGLKGIGGEIKLSPEDFQVIETPLYEPCGEGDHLYCKIRTKNQNTRDQADQLAKLFDCSAQDIGVAGLKDKQAQTTQTFSIPHKTADESDALTRINENLPMQCLSVKRHGNKLKLGHLIGNHFTLSVHGIHEDADDCFHKKLKHLKTSGIPNYFDNQRFGSKMDNAIKGKALLTQGMACRKKWLRKLLHSAYQSALFNHWLYSRIEAKNFTNLLTGDIAKLANTGSLFHVEDVAAELPRFQAMDIDYTGPIFGKKTKRATDQAGQLEDEILKKAGIEPDQLAQAGAGSRRPGRLFPKDITWECAGSIGKIAFSLPKGAYATTVMREFIRSE